MQYIDIHNLQHHFLIAHPVYADPSIKDKVIFILDQGHYKTYGFILNDPTPLNLQVEFPNLDVSSIQNTREGLIYHGGFSKTNDLFILHNYTCKRYENSYVTGPLCIGRSEEIIKDYIEHRGTDILRVFKGLMSWDNEKLYQEIIQDTWLIAPPNYDIAFADSIKRMQKNVLKTISKKHYSGKIPSPTSEWS